MCIVKLKFDVILFDDILSGFRYKMMVSTVNNRYLNSFKIFTLSFIYKLNIIGPKTDPYGTPQTIFL